jgi:hypothetical protein
MKIVFLILMLLSGIAWGQAPQLVSGWPFRVVPPGWGYSTPVLNFSGRSNEDALFINIRSQIYKFHPDASIFAGWPLTTDSAYYWLSSPIIVDIDHDTLAEVITSAMHVDFVSDLLVVVDDDGSVMPGFPITFSNGPASLNVADFDSDNEYEIMRYTYLDDMIHCLDRFGNYEPGWPIQGAEELMERNNLGSGGAVGDLDLDGYLEYILMGLYHIYAYRFDGTVQPGFPIVVQDSTTWCFTNGWVWPPILADLDHDNYPEIIVSGDNWCDDRPPVINSFISIYEHNGTIKDGWPIYVPGQLIRETPLPCDINNDGAFELGFQALELNFIDLAGNPLPGWPSPVLDPFGRQVITYSELIAIDIDGDRDCEIFLDNGSLYADSMGQDSLWYGLYGFIYGFDHFGLNLPGFPLRVGGETFSRPPNFGYEPISHRVYMAIYPTVYDILHPEQDTGRVELYLFPDSTGPPDQWPMLSHDNLMTRNYNFVDRVTSIEDEDHEILPKSPTLRQNHPNPFNTSTVIEFTLPKKELVNLSVYDILGRRVADIYDRVLEAGTHKHRLSLDAPSGVYLYRLRAGNTEITRKMALVK